MYEYLALYATFWGNSPKKKWHKTGDFRDLLLERAFFMVGTQSLPYIHEDVYDYKMLCASIKCIRPLMWVILVYKTMKY